MLLCFQQELMKAFDTPEDVRAAKSKRRESLVCHTLVYQANIVTLGGAHKLFEFKIKFMLKLQIDQILTVSKSDHSGV